MQELLNQILEYVRGCWRFRLHALLTAWVVALLGWGVVFSLPDVYEANAQVFVDTRTALRPVLENLVLDQDVNAQLNLVRQSLLANPQLELVAQEVGLIDMRSMTPDKRARVVNDMRERIKVSVRTASTQSNERDPGSIYTIQYRDSSRERAIQVVETLTNNLIENTLGGKRSGSEIAQKFLQDQIREYEMRLREAEDRLAAFKKNNIGLMPTDQGGYFQRLQAEMEAAERAQGQLALVMSRRTELEKQLRGEVPVAVSGAVSGGGASGARGGDTLSRLQEAQSRLDDLLLRFTERHPDVIAQRKTLEELKQRRAEEIEALRRGDPNAIAASGASLNPVYQSIQLALNQADVEAAALRRQIANHQAKIAELRKMLDTMPQVEAEFARLNRDYDVTRANYSALVERLEKSRLGEQATTTGSVRFDIIEPPNAGFTPVSPPRSMLILGVLAGAFAAAIGVALLMDQLNPVFRNIRSLAEQTGLRVLGAVSLINLEQHRRTTIRTCVGYAAAALALCVVGVIVLQMSRIGLRLDMTFRT
jgi:polysaccharide chain length determinant protein (PEP-CTERM system associated)